MMGGFGFVEDDETANPDLKRLWCIGFNVLGTWCGIMRRTHRGLWWQIWKLLGWILGFMKFRWWWFLDF